MWWILQLLTYKFYANLSTFATRILDIYVWYCAQNDKHFELHFLNTAF